MIRKKTLNQRFYKKFFIISVIFAFAIAVFALGIIYYWSFSSSIRHIFAMFITPNILDIFVCLSLLILDILSYFHFTNIKKHNLTQFVKNK